MHKAFSVWCIFTGCRLVMVSNTAASSTSVFTSLQAGNGLATNLHSSDCRLETPLDSTPLTESKSCYDQRTVGQSALVSCTHLGPKTRILLLSDSCRFVDTGRPLWQGDVVCHSQLPLALSSSSHLMPTNSSGHFISWVLISFLWWPLFCHLLTLPHWALSWSAEISLWLLWTGRSETSCLR
jgi:hypothetical protein